ncbi:alcohol dehydrogenase catalytic domain-containing protein [Luethyella okanaganae]|uniref:Alcohol dehydrogenase catalytic domain-containing protein n=1 Tax=Luethyella okanaganae TaxID=69372 RepID=A0ABW1VHD6_9MICO
MSSDAERFRAVVVDRVPVEASHSADRAAPRQFGELRSIDDSFLRSGDAATTFDRTVRIDVEYSSVNYKDGLAVSGRPGIARAFPLIAGIDLVGTVRESADPRWAAGDRVILNGAGLGETRHGGLAERAVVGGDSLVRLPASLSARRAAAIGTAGFTAMLAVMALERHGVGPAGGDVLVTGAAGGIGSVAIALLARHGYRVVAATGRVEQQGDYLCGLGASALLDRGELAVSGKPLQSQRWAAAIDSVGGAPLANVLAQLAYSATLNPAGISITAPVVAGAEYQHILDSLAVASREAVTPTPEAEIPAATVGLVDVDHDDVEITIERVPATTPTASTGWDFDLDEDDVDETHEIPAAVVDEPAPIVDDVEIPAEPTPEVEPEIEIPAAAEEPAPAAEEPLELPEPVAPVIRVLGQIHVDGAAGPEPRTAKTTYVAPATELLVFLALNPGATGDQVSEALWPGKATTATSNRNQLMSRARRWLGKSATDEDYLPPYVTTSSYELHGDVTSDWGIWKTLIGDNLETTPTRNLVAAMKLVDGQPFDGAPRRRYAWADSFRQEMIASIVDAAHELAERSLSIRDVATARLAAIVGKRQTPPARSPSAIDSAPRISPTTSTASSAPSPARSSDSSSRSSLRSLSWWPARARTSTSRSAPT